MPPTTPNSPADIVVTAWSNGGDCWGLKIAQSDRATYFDPAWPSVVVEINGAPHEVRIAPGFWNKCPELRSKQFELWMRANRLIPWRKSRPPRFRLTPIGSRAFRLHPPAAP